MKKLKYLLLILGMVFLTSCSSFYPVATSVDINLDVYDYNRIHWLYTNHYDYFWNATYINPYGVRCYVYNHPHFIRYRNDYYRRYHRHIPHYRHNYTRSRTYRNDLNRSM